MNTKEINTLTSLIEEFLTKENLIIQSAPALAFSNRIIINNNKLSEKQNPYYIEAYFKQPISYKEKFFFSFLKHLNNKIDDQPFIKFIKLKAPKYTSNESYDYEKYIIEYLAKTKKREVTFSYIQQKKLLSSHINLIDELLPNLQLNYSEQRILFNTISTLNVFSTQTYQNKVYVMIQKNFKNPEQYNKNFKYIDTNLQNLTSSQEHFSASLFIDKRKINAIIINNIGEQTENRSAEIIIKKINDYLSYNHKEQLKFDSYNMHIDKNTESYELIFTYTKEQPRIKLIQKIFEDTLYSVLKENKDIIRINTESFNKEKIETIIYDYILKIPNKEKGKQFKV